jgi:hypothetical protein
MAYDSFMSHLEVIIAMADYFTEDSDLVNPLVISYIVPLIGGIYEYLNWRDSRPEASQVFLYGTLGLPIGIGLNQVLSGFMIESYYLSLPALIGLAFVLRKTVLSGNEYSGLIWIYYAWIPGWILAHILESEGGHQILMKHFVLRTFAYMIMLGLLSGTLLILFAGITGGTPLQIAR